MASTNRVKGAGRSPAWAGRGKLRPAHVFGGPSEAARIIYRAGWDGSPAGLLPVSRYGQELVDELCRRKINCVCLTWSPGFSLDGDVPQWELVGRLLPLLKKKRIRPIAEISLTGCFANEMFPRVPEAKGWVERNADRTPVAHYNKDCLQMNVKNDAWRHYLAQKLRMALGAGFDGFYFSDALSNPSDTAALISQLTALAVSCRPPDADELLFYSDAWRAESLAAASNFKFAQTGARPAFDPAGVISSNLPEWKALYEFGGREKNFACAFLNNMNGKECALAAAEALAAGGVPSDPQVPQAYIDFQFEHPELFGNFDPINAVGILVGEDQQQCTQIGLCAPDLRLLAMEHIQFDVIPAQSINDFELRKYKVLSAIHFDKISPELQAALKTFVSQQGGTVLCTAASDLGITAPSESYSAGDARAITPLGKGRAIKYASNLKDGNLTPDMFRMWVEDLQKASGEQPISVEAQKGLLSVLWGKGTKRWIHLLNYGKEGAAATVLLPGCGGRKIQMYSPDVTKPQLNILETGNASAKFEVKGIETYAIAAVD